MRYILICLLLICGCNQIDDSASENAYKEGYNAVQLIVSDNTNIKEDALKTPPSSPPATSETVLDNVKTTPVAPEKIEYNQGQSCTSGSCSTRTRSYSPTRTRWRLFR